jgi:sarcosine oxidase gamma subunit
VSAASSEHRFIHTPRNGASAKPAQRKTTPAEHRVQVAAARLRVTLDERLGRETPAKTKALAKEPI